jgi:HK97 gp10 family phage protein
MGKVTLVYSKLPAIAHALPDEEEKAIDVFAEELIMALKGAVWKRHGYIGASVKDHSLDPLKADIWIGVIGAIGFYSGFQEFGTVKQAARPVVAPTAHMMEPRLVAIVSDHLRQAANAG